MKLLEIATTTNHTAEEIAHNIMAMCQPFLNAIQYKTDTYKLFRGAGKSSSPGIILPGFRKDRKPSDTPLKIHRAVNKVFQTKFGVPFRNGTFTTGAYEDADAYGSRVYIVIPINEFKFLWSTGVHDLFDFMRKKVAVDYGKFEILGHNPHIVDELVNYVKKDVFANLYQNTNLQQAIASEHEVMLYADHCFYIDSAIYDQVSQIIATLRSHTNDLT
jgi:hypothetical protein